MLGRTLFYIAVPLLLAVGSTDGVQALQATIGPGVGGHDPDTVARAAAIHGVVRDAATGEPVPAVLVRLVELGRQDLTHTDGSFHLLRVPPGSYTIAVERVGYRSRQVSVAVAEDDVEQLTIRLEPSVIDLPGIVVTGTMGARSREDALRPTQVLSGRELERQLDITLARTLEGQAGVAATSMGQAPARPVIRGLGGDRILILEDGERVGDVSSTSSDHAVALDVTSAGRVEVVRGPAALFYGSSALGGVVNVIRDEIPTTLADHPIGTVTIQGRSVDASGAAAASATHTVGSVGLRAEVSGRRADDVRTPLGDLPNTSISTYGGGAGVGLVGRGRHIGAAARTYRSEYGIPPDPVAGHPSGVTVRMERDALRAEAAVVGAGPFADARLSGAFTRYNHREIEATGSVGTAYWKNLATAELTARNDALGPFDNGGFGLRFHWEGYSSDTGRDFVRSDEYGVAFYGMQEIDLEPVRLQAGARYDIRRIAPETAGSIQGVPMVARSSENVSGSVAALLDIAAGWRLGLNLARAFRAPSAEELYSQGPHLAAYTFEIGNPRLEPESGLGADLFLRVDRPGVNAEAAVFWNQISNFAYTENTGEQRGNLFVYQFVNTDARFHGAEGSIRWGVAGPIILDGDVSWVRATNIELDEPLPLIPPLNARLALRYERDRYFGELGWMGAAEQDRVPLRPDLPAGSPGYCDQVPPDDPCRPVPGDFLPTAGYGIWNAAAGFRWFPGHQIHSVTLRLDNLTDQVFRNHLSRIKELTPEPGFGATLMYRLSF